MVENESQQGNPETEQNAEPSPPTPDSHEFERKGIDVLPAAEVPADEAPPSANIPPADVSPRDASTEE